MFPFDQPPSTAFYLVLYVATLALHVVPMNYVLAGSTYLAALSVWEAVRGRASDAQQLIAAGLRDWMPFALSVAITAGVAPLLFIQVLYKLPFYTANLLLFNRWMAILPVLIIAFYLLYLQKSKRFANKPAILRAVVSIGILVAFGFVGWSWTENHLLSTQGQQRWVELYAAQAWFYADPELAPRLALWWLGAFPALATILAWQASGRDDAPATPSEQAVIARLALVGMAGAAVAGLAYYYRLPDPARHAITGQGLPYLALATLGLLAQAACWVLVLRGHAIGSWILATLTVALTLSVIGMTALREIRRLASVDISLFYQQHADASRIGGLAVFLIFLAGNTGLILWVLYIVRGGEAEESTVENG